MAEKIILFDLNRFDRFTALRLPYGLPSVVSTSWFCAVRRTPPWQIFAKFALKNPKLDPAINRYSVNFSSEEDMCFLKKFDRSGMTSKSAFIKARIFGEPFHVVLFDKSQHEYYTKLSDFHAQFRMVGNNYNQTLKELKSHFSERRTAALVYKLEKYMMELMLIMHKVIELTDEYRQKNLEK